MASGKIASGLRRIENGWGNANAFLSPFATSAIAPNAVSKVAPKDQKEFAKLLLQSIQQSFSDLAQHTTQTSSTIVDVILGRIASLLDEVQAVFSSNDLTTAKDELLEAITNSQKLSDNDKAELFKEIQTLFSGTTSKESFDELKAWISDNVKSSSSESSMDDSSDNKQTYKNKEVDTLEDEESGEFKDSKVAVNFSILQTNIQTQLDKINDNLKHIPGKAGIASAVGAFLGGSISKLAGGIGKIFKTISSKTFLGIGTTLSKMAGGIGSIFKTISNKAFLGISAAVAGIGASVGLAIGGIKKLGAGIKSGFSKVGQGIAKPFKKIGSAFSAINPFKKHDEDREAKAERKKQAARDKIFNFISKIIDKLWKVIEPFIGKAAFFMGLVSRFVIIPIALVAAKVLLIVAAITLLGIGIYMAYQWIKKKIVAFWNYIVSGEMWKDIKAMFSKAWNWLKNIGSIIWDAVVDAVKYLFVGMWVDLGKWIWKKLCEFGTWLYDKFIYPWIVAPMEKLGEWIGQKIAVIMESPFFKSLMELVQKIKNIFGMWDGNKGFFENLKCMGTMLKDTIIEWWNESPFKVFYEERIKPFVDSITQLKDTIVKAFSSWDPNISIWENLKNIGGIIKNSVVEWWNESPFKKAYDEHIAPLIEKLKNYLGDLVKPIREWYEKSWLKKVIDSISNAIKKVLNILNIKEKAKKAAKAAINKVKNVVGKTQDKISATYLKNKADIVKLQKRLQSGDLNLMQKAALKTTLKLKQAAVYTMEKTTDPKVLNRLKEKENKAKQQQPSVPQQQITQAAKPIQSIENMQTQGKQELKQTSTEISDKIEAEKKADEAYKDSMGLLGSQMLAKMDKIGEDVNKYGNDPSAVPVPVPMRQENNSAMMGEN